MNRKKVLAAKRQAAQHIARDLETGMTLFNELLAYCGDDEEAEEALRELRQTLEKIAQPRVRRGAK